jgi:ATP-dependent protease ClpP protease subunit
MQKLNLKNYKKFTQVGKANDDDDEDTPSNPNQHLAFFRSTKTNQCIKASLDENVREAKYYRLLIQAIDSLGEEDVLLLSINTYGGHLDGAIALINAMNNTDATVHCSIDGIAASAGSLIALASPSVSVSPYASMMIHAATFGAFGKQSDVISHASFVDKQVKSLMSDVYKDFLTEQELADVFMGKEMWFNSDEIVERLERRQEIIMARHKKEEREAKKAVRTQK